VFDNKTYQREYYQRNKEKIRVRLSAWQKANPEKYREYHARTKKKNPAKFLWSRCKCRAASLGLAFDIEPSDLVLPEYCPYLGTPITVEHGKGNLPTAASVDRVDPTKGYVKGNVQIISRKANQMKQNASKEELVTFARNVLELFART
jgi:hypothetical protein